MWKCQYLLKLIWVIRKDTMLQKLQTEGKITRKVGGWHIVNYTPVSF